MSDGITKVAEDYLLVLSQKDGCIFDLYEENQRLKKLLTAQEERLALNDNTLNDPLLNTPQAVISARPGAHCANNTGCTDGSGGLVAVPQRHGHPSGTAPTCVNPRPCGEHNQSETTGNRTACFVDPSGGADSLQEAASYSSHGETGCTIKAGELHKKEQRGQARRGNRRYLSAEDSGRDTAHRKKRHKWSDDSAGDGDEGNFVPTLLIAMDALKVELNEKELLLRECDSERKTYHRAMSALRFMLLMHSDVEFSVNDVVREVHRLKQLEVQHFDTDAGLKSRLESIERELLPWITHTLVSELEQRMRRELVTLEGDSRELLLQYLHTEAAAAKSFAQRCEQVHSQHDEERRWMEAERMRLEHLVDEIRERSEVDFVRLSECMLQYDRESRSVIELLEGHAWGALQCWQGRCAEAERQLYSMAHGSAVLLQQQQSRLEAQHSALLAKKEAVIAALRDSATKAKRENRRLTAQLADRIQQLTMDFDAKMDRERKERDSLARRLLEYQEKETQGQRKHSRLLDEAHAQTQLERENVERLNANLSAAESRITGLQCSLATKTSEIRQLNKLVAALKERSAEARAIMDSAAEQLQALKAEGERRRRAAAEEAAGALAAQRVEHERKCDEVRAEVQREADTRRQRDHAEHAAAMDAVRAELEALKVAMGSEKSQFLGELREWAKQYEEVSLKCTSLQAQLRREKEARQSLQDQAVADSRFMAILASDAAAGSNRPPRAATDGAVQDQSTRNVQRDPKLETVESLQIENENLRAQVSRLHAACEQSSVRMAELREALHKARSADSSRVELFDLQLPRSQHR